MGSSQRTGLCRTADEIRVLADALELTPAYGITVCLYTALRHLHGEVVLRHTKEGVAHHYWRLFALTNDRGYITTACKTVVVKNLRFLRDDEACYQVASVKTPFRYTYYMLRQYKRS